MNKILETTRFVAENSKSVKIQEEKIVGFSNTFHHGNFPHWLSKSPIKYSHLNNEDLLDFLLVFNSTSFCYWGNPKWAIEYRGRKYDGSWGMVASIVKAIERGIPILDAGYRSNITKKDYGNILEGNTEIPLFEERWKITKEIGSVLLKQYQGNVSGLVRRAQGDGLKLLELIVENLPSFKDVREYDGRKVYFYKRAQLLVADIYQIFGGETYGHLSNIDQLTACADYKLPQSLRKLGILTYSKDLEEKVDNFIQISENSPEEVEIRASTIWAVEMIRIELEKQGKPTTSIGINDHLWLMSQEKGANDKPYHRTVTTSY